jgi:hypothetical protein
MRICRRGFLFLALGRVEDRPAAGPTLALRASLELRPSLRPSKGRRPLPWLVRSLRASQGDFEKRRSWLFSFIPFAALGNASAQECRRHRYNTTSR